MGVLDAAASALGRAAQQLDHATIELFWARRRMCDWDLYSEAEADARQKADTQVFLLLAVNSSPAEQLDCARRAAAAMALPRPSEPPRAQIKRGQRLRIGYVSANFRAHAGAFLISGLIEQHDRQAFEIIGYSASPDDGSQNARASSPRSTASSKSRAPRTVMRRRRFVLTRSIFWSI